MLNITIQSNLLNQITKESSSYYTMIDNSISIDARITVDENGKLKVYGKSSKNCNTYIKDCISIYETELKDFNNLKNTIEIHLENIISLSNNTITFENITLYKEDNQYKVYVKVLKTIDGYSQRIASIDINAITFEVIEYRASKNNPEYAEKFLTAYNNYINPIEIPKATQKITPVIETIQQPKSKYTTLYTENNVTISGTYDSRHDNVINEIIITKDNNNIYSTGNNLYVNAINFKTDAENIVFLINNIDIYTTATNKIEYIDSLLNLYFYDNNITRFNLAIKRIRIMINEKIETEKSNLITQENKSLLTQIASISTDKQILVYNLFSTVILLKNAPREFSRDMIKSLYELNKLEDLKQYNMSYHIFKHENYNGNFKYMIEIENAMYKDVLKHLEITA